MRSSVAIAVVLFLLPFLSGCSMPSPGDGSQRQTRPAVLGPALAFFEPNMGQADPDVQFIARTGSLEAWVTGTTVLQWDGAGRTEWTFSGHQVEAVPLDLLTSTGNIHRPGLDLSGVHHYARLLLTDVAPGIDLVLHFNRQGLEYDLIARPGSDLGAYSLTFPNSTVELVDGNLMVSSATGTSLHMAPIAWDQSSGESQPVHFVPFGNHVRFAAPAWNGQSTLVIDPVIPVYSSFVGGLMNEIGGSIAAAGPAHVAVALHAYAMGGSPGGVSGATDVYVVEYDSTTGMIGWTLLLGGPGTEEVADIIWNPQLGVYHLAGRTSSSGLATLGAAQAAYGGGSSDAFVATVSSTGSVLALTYAGGADEEWATGVWWDAARGLVEATGVTRSSAFPTTPGAYKPTNTAAPNLAPFVQAYNAGLTWLGWSTFFGAMNGHDLPHAITSGPAGMYVVGMTNELAFPTTTWAADKVLDGPADAFLAVIGMPSPGATSLEYATFIGGSKVERAEGVAVTRDGTVLVAGSTNSVDFPTTSSAFQAVDPGNDNGWVVEVRLTPPPLTSPPVPAVTVPPSMPSTNPFVYSTYLGGSESEGIRDLWLDASGRFAVVQPTSSYDYPITSGGFPPPWAPGTVQDVAVTMFHHSGIGTNPIVWSTFVTGGLAGPDPRSAHALMIDSSGLIHIAGNVKTGTYGPGMLPGPATPFQPTFGGGVWDGLVIELECTPGPNPC